VGRSQAPDTSAADQGGAAEPVDQRQKCSSDSAGEAAGPVKSFAAGLGAGRDRGGRNLLHQPHQQNDHLVRPPNPHRQSDGANQNRSATSSTTAATASTTTARERAEGSAATSGGAQGVPQQAGASQA